MVTVQKIIIMKFWFINKKSFTRVMASIVSTMPVSFLSTTPIKVVIAIGSNVGNRVLAINEAINKVKLLGDFQCTSFLYETAPMYHLDQTTFLNAACLLETKLGPFELLSALKSIEQTIGRNKTFVNGPRLIDLDIITYGNTVIKSNDLIIPHPRLSERAFVLKPVCDIDETLVHPILKKNMKELYDLLPNEAKKDIVKVLPVNFIPYGVDATDSLDEKKFIKEEKNKFYENDEKQTKFIKLNGKPLIFGILNVTPDRLIYFYFICKVYSI
jgi:2-amino-4-hydroxy-6-hydroxymethyldihydropteridine diphosphokinase